MTFMEGNDFNAAKLKWHEVSAYVATVANRLTKWLAFILVLLPHFAGELDAVCISFLVWRTVTDETLVSSPSRCSTW